MRRVWLGVWALSLAQGASADPIREVGAPLPAASPLPPVSTDVGPPPQPASPRAATGPVAADVRPVVVSPARLPSGIEELSLRVLRLEDQQRKSESAPANVGVIALLNQVDALKAEVSRLRGLQEELAFRLQKAEQRQKDVLADFDGRLKETHELASRPRLAPILPAGVEAAAAQPKPVEPAPDPEAEARTYEAGLKQFKGGDHVAAIQTFSGFLDKYPNSPLAGNACYWQGLAYFAIADHKNAAAAQQRLLRDYPEHSKVPDAMVSLARAQIQMGETENARLELERVRSRYPTTRAAELAKKILALFK
ncbi:MAG: tol-pal system protein YbgF [Pseudomonadota bacterium]